jgi:hypothetical protein
MMMHCGMVALKIRSCPLGILGWLSMTKTVSGKNMADDVSDFLADFDEKALNELELRLDMANAQAQNLLCQSFVAASRSSSFESNSEQTPASFSKTISPADTVPEHEVVEDGCEMNFLAELEREVASRKDESSINQGRNLKDQELHDALSRIFSFLHRVSAHANKLQPEITRAYRLDAQTAYQSLRWHDAFADSRKQDLSEKARLSHVNFRMRLVAPQEVALTRRWDQLEALKNDLHILNLRMLDEPGFAKKPEQEFIKLQLAADFPLQINFKANYKAHRIDITSRNLEGFCVSTFVLDVAAVNQALLDELGRFLLSRTPSLPKALHRVNYMPPSKNR